jgi:cobalt-zinc-cadmium efflux system outer membrane protein
MPWIPSIGRFVGSPRRARTLRLALALAGPVVAVRPVASQEAPAAQPVLTLRGVLESVAGHHPAIEAANARARAAAGARSAAGALGNPVFGVQLENAPLPGGPQPPMDRETMATATFPLEPLYQRGARVHRAASDLRASEADAAGVRQRVTLAAVRAYHRAALAQVVVDADDDLVAWLDSLVAYNRNRVTEGVAAEADLLRALLERDRAVAEAATHASELAGAATALAEFVDPARVIRPGDGALVRVEVTAEPLELPAGRAMSPDSTPLLPGVRAARERLDASGAAIAVERTMLVRQVGVMVGLKQSVGTTSFVGGFSVPLPLLDWNRGEITRRKGERDAAASDLAAEERAAAAILAGVAASARVLTERVAALALPSADGSPAMLSRADLARQIALGAYREGAVPLFGVLDAAHARGEARRSYYEALFAQREAVLTLRSLRGEDLLSVLPPGEKGPGR